MNDKDKEAFIKYMAENLPYSYYVSYHCPELKTWQAACEYKDKELMEWKEAARSEAQEVNSLQAENKKLRDALNNWVQWENGQIIMNGEYSGEDINRLINKAREALKKDEGA